MVKLNKIYTRTGDAGETGLVDGSRVSKADPRLAAIGDVDEANCAIGVALLAIEAAEAREMLARIQNELFDLGADLATPEGIEGALRILPEQVARLEREIDRMNEDLEPLRSFILPGGGRARPRFISPARWCGAPSGRRWLRLGSAPPRSPISTASRTICSCWRVGSRVETGTFCGSPARRADICSSFVPESCYCSGAGGA